MFAQPQPCMPYRFQSRAGFHFANSEYSAFTCICRQSALSTQRCSQARTGIWRMPRHLAADGWRLGERHSGKCHYILICKSTCLKILAIWVFGVYSEGMTLVPLRKRWWMGNRGCPSEASLWGVCLPALGQGMQQEKRLKCLEHLLWTWLSFHTPSHATFHNDNDAIIFALCLELYSLNCIVFLNYYDL